MKKILFVTKYPVIVAGLSSITKEIIAEDIEIQIVDSVKQTGIALASGQIQMMIFDLDVEDGERSELQKLVKHHSSVKKILLYEYRDDDFFKWMYQLGVNAILDKSSSIERIKTCISMVQNDEIYLENAIIISYINTNQQIEALTYPLRYIDLTKRETLIAKLLIEGNSNIQICKLLKLQPSTVSTLKNRVFKKLKVTNLFELEKTRQIAI